MITTRLGDLYREILDSAVEGLGSDAGSIQVVDMERGGLRLVASRGFDPVSAGFWEFVKTGSTTTCGTALAEAERVVVADVEEVQIFAGSPDLREWRRSGLRAMQSTPLRASDGSVIGMLSTHWRSPRQPSEPELLLIDLVARLADPERLGLRCAWCDRFEIGNAFVEPPVLAQPPPPLLHDRATHGICPDCLDDELLAEADAFDDKAQRVGKTGALRQVNAGVRQAAGSSTGVSSTDASWEFACECGDLDCTASINLSLDEFDVLRDREESVLADGHTLDRAVEARRQASELRGQAAALRAQADHQRGQAQSHRSPDA